MPKTKKAKRPRYEDLMATIVSTKRTLSEEKQTNCEKIRMGTGGGTFNKLEKI